MRQFEFFEFNSFSSKDYAASFSIGICSASAAPITLFFFLHRLFCLYFFSLLLIFPTTSGNFFALSKGIIYIIILLIRI